ncbi:MAG: TIGR03960 family B12-binding radical SAM protein [Deltaproteobacteria bacterium]|nr:TIGR03960 family B12-binding radical SAM protein [Deltaproteobacteria bacterium]
MNKKELLLVSKPSRYMGGEINAIVKDLNRVRLKFALAFPDVYEVGMSHLGLQILYHILNQDAHVACERVFAPWPDMEKFLRERDLPLTSLESSLPLKEFDVIGFSLQYELNYTGVLNILDLSGIPLKAADRGENDPIIIGGGPCALNPEPLTDFFDAFILGDGEEAVLKICREIIDSREKAKSKAELLASLSGIEGVYIPSFFQMEYEPDGIIKNIIPRKTGYSTVLRCILPDLDRGDFPKRPILPYLEVIHDRLNIEIARGCTRGCRFCQAGMIYRPLRERSPQIILHLVEECLKSTGHDEVSLLSLSTGDYSCIEPLLTRIIDRYRNERVAVSLPSLRVETLTPSLIQKIREVRKTGFTLAPEAGTERLRQVINKGNTEEDLLATIRAVFMANWQMVKLYFMLGLPTETEDDLGGVVSLCRKALTEARRAKGSAHINVSISNFIPKAHTPFQWEPQCSAEETTKKQKYLRKNLEQYGFRLKWSDPRLSLLEGVFARGDRRLGLTLMAAYNLGCRLDGWGDHFRYDLWEKAFAQTGLHPFFYAFRRRELNEILPWDHLNSRIAKRFLEEERRKAFAAIPTGDCRRAACNGCGVCGGADLFSNRIANDVEVPCPNIPLPKKPNEFPFPIRRFRSQFAKSGPAKFIGHLELSRSMIRAFRRAQFPLVFSQGFHPLPKVSFGPPLPVGYESFAEFFDYQIKGKLDPEEAAIRLNALLPPGIKILKTQEINLKSSSIFDSIIGILYRISFIEPDSLRAKKIDFFRQEEKIPVFWTRKNKPLDLKTMVESLSLADELNLEMKIRSGPGGIIRPEEVLDFIFCWPEGNRPSLSVQKIQVQFKESDPWPMKS